MEGTCLLPTASQSSSGSLLSLLPPAEDHYSMKSCRPCMTWLPPLSSLSSLCVLRPHQPLHAMIDAIFPPATGPLHILFLLPAQLYSLSRTSPPKKKQIPYVSSSSPPDLSSSTTSLANPLVSLIVGEVPSFHRLVNTCSHNSYLNFSSHTQLWESLTHISSPHHTTEQKLVLFI